MTSRFVQWTLDVQDVGRMARFWAGALGYRIGQGDDGAAKLYPPADAPPGTPTLWLQPSAGPKAGKIRAHPDLVAWDGDRAAEVARLLALGARRVDIGQTGEDDLTVLADPEGNEFCVLERSPI
ncbi:VOC family protein [Actinoplanes sp. RD1]|uniref:VOC family protein n=1 Tax=Actinoplanes sp. RD1 TaxID=3064538 RepID=UPI00274142A6|nr:VOC family protein [Actinoplanes sp. RD1]